MLTSSPSLATRAASSPSSSARLTSLRRKKPSHHTRRPPPSRSISMFSSLKSLVTTPLSWFANATNDSFESEDTPGKRKLVHSPANPYDSEGDQKDAPSAYRAKRIRLDSPDRVATLPVPPAPAQYLDPPTPSFRASTLPRIHASKPARLYAPSSNTISIPRPDTSRLSPLSFHQPPRTQAAPIARTMSMDPPTARRTSIQELPPPISRDVSMESSPNTSTQPSNPPFRMRSALTPQPGAPPYGPNPQRRERNPSEPPPLTALIENPIFVKPPSVQHDQRRMNDGSNLTLGSLVDTQKSSLSNRSHSTLVLRHEVPDGLRPTNAAELALQQLERYRTPLVPSRLGSGNVDVALPELFQARKKARALVLMKRDKRDDKPRLGHASKYINSSKEKDKDTPSKSKNSKPYAGEGGLKKLLARRKQEVIDAEFVEDPDVQAMADDSEREPELTKRMSRITEPVRTPATFARKVSAPPPSSVPSFGLTSRKPTHFRTNRARTVGPTRTRNRFTAAYEDDEADGADDLAVMPEEPPKEKDSSNSNIPKFEPPSGFSFAPPPSVTSIPLAQDTSSGRDEPPISALPFTLSKPPMPKVMIPAPATFTLASQPPMIAFVPPTPEGPQRDEPASEPAPPNFFTSSQIFARTGITPPQSVSNAVSKPEPEPVSQVADPAPVSKSETGTIPEPLATSTPPSRAPDAAASTSAQSPSSETEKPPPPTPFNFGQSTSIQPTLTSSSKQPSTGSSLPFSLTPLSAPQQPKKDDAGAALPKPLFGGATASFPGFGTSVSAAGPSTKATAQSAGNATASFSFPKIATLAPAESVEPLKPGFSLAQSPSLTSASASALSTESSKPPGSSTPFSFDQSAKQTATAAPSTPAKSIFTFGPSSTTPSTAEKPTVTSTGFTFGPSTTTPASAPTGLLFGSPAPQSETKPATSTGGFSFGTPAPAPANASKPAFPFGTATPARTVTPPPADDGMRMEESPTRGGGMDINGGSAKPQSLPQLQMPGASKSGFSFSTNTSAGFGSPSPSPFGGNLGSGFTFGQQNQTSSQGTNGGFNFNTNTKASEGSNGGFSFAASKPAETTPAGFTFGQSTTDSNPSPSTGFTFGQPGPKTADATSSGFSFKAPEPIQHSTSFTFGQTLPEPARPSSSTGFGFGQAQPQQPATTAPFTFSPPASGGAFGSAPASPAFGAQQLAPAPSTPFPFAGPTSAPAQQPAPNPFGFGSGGGQPTSPAVQQGFTFNLGGGTPQTPAGPFVTSTPQTPGTGNSESAIFTMGAPSPKAVPPPGSRLVKKLPTRRNANVKR